jgi:hypothetical protein
MTGEAGQAGSGADQARAHVDWFCDWIRQGAERTAQMFTPPPSAGQHFREARLEFLRGMRDLLDHRIDRLSRDRTKGTRVNVD